MKKFLFYFFLLSPPLLYLRYHRMYKRMVRIIIHIYPCPLVVRSFGTVRRNFILFLFCLYKQRKVYTCNRKGTISRCFCIISTLKRCRHQLLYIRHQGNIDALGSCFWTNFVVEAWNMKEAEKKTNKQRRICIDSLICKRFSFCFYLAIRLACFCTCI